VKTMIPGISVAFLAALLLLPGGMALADATFSIDLTGPTIGAPDSFYGRPISSADVLCSPFPGPPLGWPRPMPLPSPGQVVQGGVGAPPPGVRALGLVPGRGNLPELDALSYGRDEGPKIHFSVDEYAAGHPSVPATPPNVFTEGHLGAAEASADVYRDASISGLTRLLGMLPPASAGPPVGPEKPGNTLVIDGNALPSPALAVKGVGLIEPNPVSPGAADPGDNIDALDIDTQVSDLSRPLFFSLDASFADPLEPGLGNTGTAIANGYVGGDVIVNVLGKGNLLYAPAAVLGLDLDGPDTDDLDALVLNESGDLLFDPVSDLLLFSLRRASFSTFGGSSGAVLDSLWGVPIEEGDVLAPPGTVLPSGIVIPGPTPGIVVPGEWLGLFTVRSTPAGTQVPFYPYGDDLDALDLAIPEPANLVWLGAGLLALAKRKRSA